MDRDMLSCYSYRCGASIVTFPVPGTQAHPGLDML